MPLRKGQDRRLGLEMDEPRRKKKKPEAGTVKSNIYNKVSKGERGTAGAAVSMKRRELLPGYTLKDTPAYLAKPNTVIRKRRRDTII